MLNPLPFNPDTYLPLDFSANNPDLASFDLTDVVTFSRYVSDTLREAGAVVGIGGYAEDRVLYRHSGHFTPTDEEPRTIHLGVDFWAEAGTPVLVPVAGIVHSFANNAGHANYGPTIILEHNSESSDRSGFTRYSLYGHLSRRSLEGLYEGKPFRAGEQLAELGPYPENGNWPPHLHFQLMHDLLGHHGDFPGVCRKSEQAKWLMNCPDPGGFLR